MIFEHQNQKGYYLDMRAIRESPLQITGISA